MLVYYYKATNSAIRFSNEPLPTGLRYRELPKWIKDSKSITNIQNKDDHCFEWCILRHFYKEPGINYRVTKYLKDKDKGFTWFGLDNPETFNEENLCKFEDYHNIRVVIFGIKKTTKRKFNTFVL
jgi:hypothetical protein